MSNVNCEAIQNHEKEIDSKTAVKSQFIEILENADNYDTFENVITSYIHRFGDTISADQCCQIIELLSNILYPKIAKLNNIKRISCEKAIYLEKYLDGKMYNDEELFIKYRDIQKNNAQAIIDICK